MAFVFKKFVRREKSKAGTKVFVAEAVELSVGDGIVPPCLSCPHLRAGFLHHHAAGANSTCLASTTLRRNTKETGGWQSDSSGLDRDAQSRG